MCIYTGGTPIALRCYYNKSEYIDKYNLTLNEKTVENLLFCIVFCIFDEFMSVCKTIISLSIFLYMFVTVRQTF